MHNFIQISAQVIHNDVIWWKHIPSYWPFVRGIHRSPMNSTHRGQWRPFMRGFHQSSVNSPHKGQWRGDLVFSLICAWTNGWVKNQTAGDLRRHYTYYDVIVMSRWIWMMVASQKTAARVLRIKIWMPNKFSLIAYGLVVVSIFKINPSVSFAK